ncbi:MAG: hypothetical protein R3B09_26730 [Nannocystaceae bacterium]
MTAPIENPRPDLKSLAAECYERYRHSYLAAFPVGELPEWELVDPGVQLRWMQAVTPIHHELMEQDLLREENQALRDRHHRHEESDECASALLAELRLAVGNAYIAIPDMAAVTPLPATFGALIVRLHRALEASTKARGSAPAAE